MANFLRMLLGFALLPACWGAGKAFFLCLGDGSAVNTGTFSALAGVVAFSVLWFVFPHPVKAYVFGHEMTHALWGILFGARPSKMKVGEKGGSVELTKSNMLITLSPYFFPFYTFVALLATFVISFFAKPVPYMPLWLFVIGFTWAFHVLFTIQSLTTKQPDIALYGRIFSWTFIFLVNAAILLVWCAATADRPVAGCFGTAWSCVSDAYGSAYGELKWCWTRLYGMFKG